MIRSIVAPCPAPSRVAAAWSVSRWRASPESPAERSLTTSPPASLWLVVTTKTRALAATPRVDPKLHADAESLHAALSELVRVYQFRDRDRICCHDVSVTQCYALEALLRRGPSSLNELASELYLDKSTASRVVATLRRKGYVTRAP